MARQVIVLALVLFAIVGLASAAEAPAHAPTLSPTVASGTDTPAESPDDVIGNTTDDSPGYGDDGEGVVAAPMGSDMDMDIGPSAAEAPKSGASALQVSALAGVAAVAAGFFF